MSSKMAGGYCTVFWEDTAECPDFRPRVLRCTGTGLQTAPGNTAVQRLSLKEKHFRHFKLFIDMVPQAGLRYARGKNYETERTYFYFSARPENSF